jgi:hypothetical protein
MNTIAIALVAGLLSAILHGAIGFLGLGGLLLFYVAPFPIIIVALAYRWHLGLIASAAGALGLALALDPNSGLAFFFGVGLPATLLGYLVLLAQQNQDGTLEWFPIGHVVAAAAVLSALVVCGGMIAAGGFTGFDLEARKTIEAMLNQGMITAPDLQTPTLDGQTPASVDTAAVFVRLLPIAGALSLLLSYLLSLFVAARILRGRNQLMRPWPQISSLRLPFWAALVLGGGIAASVLGGEIMRAGEVFAATMVLAFTLQGLALIHDTSRGKPWRPLALTGVYMTLLFFTPLALFLSLYGLSALFSKSKTDTPKPPHSQL